MPPEPAGAVNKADVADKVGSLLMRLSEEIEQLGETLCEDEQIAMRHIAVLQRIDTIAQKQRILSDLLTCQDPQAAIASIGLETLQAQFQ